MLLTEAIATGAWKLVPSVGWVPPWEKLYLALIGDPDQRGPLKTIRILGRGEFARAPGVNKDNGCDITRMS